MSKIVDLEMARLRKQLQDEKELVKRIRAIVHDDKRLMRLIRDIKNSKGGLTPKR